MKKIEDDRKIEEVLKEQFFNLTKQGHEVFFISLYGSQRYGIDTETSDYDLRACILPSFEDVLLGGYKISKKVLYEQGEIDIKDIRLLFQIFLKMNINFLEAVSNEMVYVNPEYEVYYRKLFKMRDEVSKYDLIKLLSATKGMVHEKYKALEHPYPSKIHLIEEFGYDGKQLSHMLRLEMFLDKYLETKDFYGSLIVPEEQRHFLIKVKRNQSYTLGDAQFIAKTTLDKVSQIADKERKALVEQGYKPNEQVKKDLDSLAFEILRKKIKRDILQNP